MDRNSISQKDEQIEWLLKNGGPVIRYRTARELLAKPSHELEEIERELLATEAVNIWLERLGIATDHNPIHSSKVTAYENAMGKLIQLGCHCGMELFDQQTQPYKAWLQPVTTTRDFGWNPFQRMVIGSLLIAAGYYQELALQAYFKERLDTLWRFTRELNFDIYADRKQYSDIPKGFRDKPLVKPEFYVGGDEQFPTIYDMYALANYPVQQLSENEQRKIDAVLAYVLHPRYQSFPEGYGLMRAGPRKYYAIGWSVHLPRYQHIEANSYDDSRFIQRLALMSNFQVAREHSWFQESVESLEAYRTARGTYIFPRSFLPERTSGYWVIGAYMGFAENRRKRITLELESTFWMLKIKQ